METGLVNLKAELHKKRTEIKQFKTGERGLFSKASGPKKVRKPDRVNSGVDSRAAKDLHEVSQETPSEAQAKAILEEKADLYQKLHSGVEVLENDSLNEKFLINFQKKIIDKVLHKKKFEEEKKQGELEKENPDEYLADGPEDEWVEYTDALGRTRECMRKDLADMKQRDREIMGLDEDEEKKTSDCEEEQYQDWAQHMQRTKWEQQEAENRVKPNLHYQDVLFDEARSHGVGYVKLSGDAEKRKTQLDLLTQLRSDMEQAAAAKSVSDAKKKKLMDIRLAKVKQRKRLKMGLPMTETIEDKLKTPQLSDDEGDDVVNPQIPIATPEHQSQEVSTTVKESVTKKTSTREWDIGKSGVSSLTQEEWVERNRCQRNKEFAPPSVYKSSGRDRHKRQRSDTDFGRDSFNKPDDRDQGQNSSSTQFWSSSLNSQSCRDEEMDEPRINEFAPPATYEYYGPSSKGNRNKPKKTDLDDAINQGLAYYRSKTQ
ncbi:coiled-coil domain-containing protein 174 isoform X2 [Oratosquilla oratoria]|uniref:coiled-coil domain-containing protein 174 isoform X2 n=1 Tax=Oratosquilla oratoria TaxID=337810 RepID=UPI003F769629